MDDERATFDLDASLRYYHDSPNSVPCSEADQELLDAEENPESLSNAQINQILDPIIDSLAVNPDTVARSSVLDNLQCLLKYFTAIPIQAASKVLDIIVSGLSVEIEVLHHDIEGDEQDSSKEHRELLEIYGFLLQWVVAGLEARSSEKSGPSTAVVGAGRKGKGKGKAGQSDLTTQLKSIFEVMCKALKLKLLRVFVTTSERDAFLNLFTRPSYLVLESEQWVKSETIKMHIFKVLCMAVKHHGHAFGAQTSILQNLTYFEHLSEPMAEFLQILSEQYDYPQLVDEILRELSNKEFNSNDLKGPKSVSSFIMSLSERAPRLVMRQMTLLVKLLESDFYNLRNAIIEVTGNLIVELTKDDEKGETHMAQIEAFFDLLEERFLDINPYCRSKTIQIYSSKLIDLNIWLPKRRQNAAELACRSLEDKSSNVRRYAIKLLTNLVAGHQFGSVRGGILQRSEWANRLETLEAELNVLIRPAEQMAGSPPPGNETVDAELLDDATDHESEDHRQSTARPDIPTAQPEQDHMEIIARLQFTRKFCVQAIRFIDTIHTASEIVMQLLSAKNKSEIIEAMDFFRVLDFYQVETSKAGILRMLRLIWIKGNSDEGKGVQAHLIETYKQLFFNAPDTYTENECANQIARNMISLTFDTTAAELTSLEQLLSKMMTEGHISDLVVQKLWQIYGAQKSIITELQRRGSIIVLGMLALAEPDIVVKELETILRVGLGSLGRTDLGLAKYTCLALRHISPTAKKAKDAPSVMGKLPNDHMILIRLASLIELPSDSNDWLGMAEQAISAIYALAKYPDVLCTEIIRRKTKAVFGHPQPTPLPADPAEDQVMQEAGLFDAHDVLPGAPPEALQNASPFPLAQLLFVVGHVAIKQIVHLEILELEFKRRKTEQEKVKEAGTLKNKRENDEQDELDLISGTTEDDFTEGIQRVRFVSVNMFHVMHEQLTKLQNSEQELLYGKNSLLSSFGPLVGHICSCDNNYFGRTLHAQATLCMAKLMCVSAEFCEAHIALLLSILEDSLDPITRSNILIALGDIAVCFNHVMDENSEFVYKRLNDKDPSVKRICLMTLTFLILAGQVKVKGHLGAMARCLEDSDKRIVDLSRMFFTELATKDNAVYNHFIDVFSLLSADKEVSEDSMKRIVKYLASFIEKDKHAKQLSEKLAARLPRCETERQWNDVAYVLSLLPHKNEEIQKLVAKGFRLVQGTA